MNKKRIVALLVFILSCLVLITATNQSWMRAYSKWAYSNQGLLGSDKYSQGDLYGISYYPGFGKDFKEAFLSPLQDSIHQTKDLTILGDSYFYSYFDPNVPNFIIDSSFHLYIWNRKNTLHAPTDSSILLIEMVERNIFQQLNLANIKTVFEPTNPQTSQTNFNSLIEEHLYHPTLKENLEFILFSHRLFSKIKEAKSWLDLHVFGNKIQGVEISANQEFLFMEETVDPTNKASSYYAYTDHELGLFVQELNAIQSYVKGLGYSDVYFSIIPNPVRLLEAGDSRMNSLFDDLATFQNREWIFIDPRPSLSQDPTQNFYHSDSHWNLTGASKFRDLINHSFKE